MKKFLLYLLVLLLLGGAVIGYLGYQYVFSPNVQKDTNAFYIYPGEDYQSVKQRLESNAIINNASSFDLVAKLMKYQGKAIPSGKYKITAGMSNRELIAMLRAGRQTPVNVTFNNVRKIDNLAGSLSTYFHLDSMELYNALTSDSFLQANGVNMDDVLTLFIPNTYQMYWDYPADKIVNRLIVEKEKFWKQNDRLEKAVELGLSPREVYTLASIVEKESNHKPERPIIAGLYLNRINRGIPLQADPTVVFASGIYDLKRVLNKHLEIDSPFNTYRYPGLPPGPITMPSINSIDAVLNHKNHDYLYMCAKPGYGSEHAFAETLRQHEINANRYRRWLNSEGIR